MKYALIGCGRIATNHMKAAVNNGLEIVAVCDILPEAMRSFTAWVDVKFANLPVAKDFGKNGMTKWH